MSARLLIAGAASGVGKTTFTAGLCRALIRRGLRVAVFKCGPDYLDPTYHRLASGRTVHNLDGFLMDRSSVRDTFARNAAAVDVSLIEGVMGLFDGVDPTGLAGSSAEIANWLEAPIVLVCDARGMARSVAALAHGFAHFEPSVTLHGMICNRIGSSGHLALLRRAERDVPVLGGLLKDASHAFPERHLGLHSADEIDPAAAFDAFADQIEQLCDVDRLLAIARSVKPLPPSASDSRSTHAQRCRIAVARDEAFHFYYDANLRLLERAGAELIEFSPLRALELPDVDGLYIGGGYPESHAARLEQNHSLRRSLRDFAARGRPIYAECGGLMYLSEHLVTGAGDEHEMVGLISGRAIMTERLQALGYVEVETKRDSLLGPAGTRFRGHQFRHSRFETIETPNLYRMVVARSGDVLDEGYGRDQLVASYVHAHWGDTPAIAEAFVDRCARR
ncbi:MAG TPA: cobyrinate a,c-diamide synthase [Polyangiales bacterium]